MMVTTEMLEMENKHHASKWPAVICKSRQINRNSENNHIFYDLLVCLQFFKITLKFTEDRLIVRLQSGDSEMQIIVLFKTSLYAESCCWIYSRKRTVHAKLCIYQQYYRYLSIKKELPVYSLSLWYKYISSLSTPTYNLITSNPHVEYPEWCICFTYTFTVTITRDDEEQFCYFIQSILKIKRKIFK